MLKETLIHFFITSILVMSTPVFASEDASVQQVYEVAKSGRLTEALVMMDSVLADHPNSAKAHYVEAELLAKKGELSAARAELEKAEQLKPGLPFVHPESLTQLKATLNMSNSHTFSPFSAATGIPFGLSLSSIFLLVFIMVVVALIMRRFMRAGNSTFGGASNAYRPMSNNQSVSQSSGYQPMTAQPVASASMGSGIMSGLATGAAVGAGMIAGEALAHHFLDGDRATASGVSNPFIDDTSATTESRQFDMGGSGFGIADNDAASWDDANDSSNDDSWS